jgi:hypothetical protein
LPFKRNLQRYTTGGDRVKLLEDVKAGGTFAVIAPQMVGGCTS